MSIAIVDLQEFKDEKTKFILKELAIPKNADSKYDIQNSAGCLFIENGGDSTKPNIFQKEYVETLFYQLSLRKYRCRLHLKYTKINSDEDMFDMIISTNEIPDNFYLIQDGEANEDNEDNNIEEMEIEDSVDDESENEEIDESVDEELENEDSEYDETVDDEE
ncbi:acidic leucine-rich nuclear phosphoprotein 32 family member B-like [Chrysoperla carnea]|uniref:acidic leucine-rich nuclear phosphoprotein 32 family member B-like n=1 Tax=Chrysoperla carnea TaxID=189513 RepID=UPI001D07288D|nr:acidic leucine-rich nuclear phosphoprotein 32 family member B-like [Chrysoperla carnea]